MRGLAYLNYAGLAPVRMGSVLSGALPVEVLGNALLPLYFRCQDEVREQVAAWLGVRGRNVALLPSTTAALQAVARTLRWQTGDIVLYPAGDFPSNVFPWQDLERYGVRAVPVSDWSEPWPEQTRLVAISTVDFTTGAERPWQAVCTRARAANIWTCVDAIQSAGIKPAYSLDVDFWAAGVQKWLVSGLGLALLVVSDRALTAEEGPGRSYLALREPPRADSGMRDDARRWEMGWVAPAAVLRFRSNLRYFQHQGWGRIGAGVRRQRDHLHRELLSIGWPVVSPPDAWSGIVTIDPSPLSAHTVVQAGYRARVVTAERGPYVRLSAHVFTRQGELQRALDWLWRLRTKRAEGPCG